MNETIAIVNPSTKTLIDWSDRLLEFFPYMEGEINPGQPLKLETIERMEKLQPIMREKVTNWDREKLKRIHPKLELNLHEWTLEDWGKNGRGRSGESYFHLSRFLEKWESINRDYDTYVQEFGDPEWNLSIETIYDVHVSGF